MKSNRVAISILGVIACTSVAHAENPLRLPHLKPAPFVTVASEKKVTVHLVLEPGWKINPGAPSWLELSQPLGVPPHDARIKKFVTKQLTTQKVMFQKLKPGITYRLRGTLYFCQEKNASVCVLQSHDQELRAEAKGGVTQLDVSLTSNR